MLFEYNDKTLNLSVVKLSTIIFSTKDEQIIEKILKGDLFENIIKIYLKEHKRKNLLISATLEMFDKLGRDNNQKIIQWLVSYNIKILIKV